MADANTTRYQFVKPEVGASADTWGAKLNTNLDDVDALIGAITTAGSSNAYALTTGLSLAAYVAGQSFDIKASFSNSGAVTIAVDGLATKAITKNGTTALVTGDLVSGQIYRISYDGTQFQLVGTTGTGVYQPLDPTLTALGALSYTSGTLVITMTAADTFALVSDALYAHLAGTESFSGQKNFTNATLGFKVSSTVPRWEMEDTDAGSDEKLWDDVLSGATRIMRTRTDADGAGQTWLSIVRSGTTVSTIDFSNGALQSGGVAVLVAGKIAVPIPASAMVTNTTNGPSSATSESTTNKVMTRTLDFDTTTQESAQFLIPMPKGWNEGTVTFQPLWTASAGSAADTVVWDCAGVALSDDDAIDTAFGTAQTSSDALIATGDVHIGPESSAITIAGSPAEGDLVVFRVRRVPASDNLPNDAKLIGIRLFITTNAKNDA